MQRNLINLNRPHRRWTENLHSQWLLYAVADLTSAPKPIQGHQPYSQLLIPAVVDLSIDFRCEERVYLWFAGCGEPATADATLKQTSVPAAPELTLRKSPDPVNLAWQWFDLFYWSKKAT